MFIVSVLCLLKIPHFEWKRHCILISRVEQSSSVMIYVRDVWVLFYLNFEIFEISTAYPRILHKLFTWSYPVKFRN